MILPPWRSRHLAVGVTIPFLRRHRSRIPEYGLLWMREPSLVELPTFSSTPSARLLMQLLIGRLDHFPPSRSQRSGEVRQL